MYIILSKVLDKYLVSESKNKSRRLQLHNEHYFKKSYTKSATDWVLKLVFECENKLKAQKLERFVKRMKSRTFIEKVALKFRNKKSRCFCIRILLAPPQRLELFYLIYSFLNSC
ncbi:GIY-YIG nuclease family protein [Psychroflexus salis]|uniref:GIY-YIG nuclease family protein n=1 Tax=Psychroflexus salis TaxID=1526574 RepID=UPI0021D23A87|nr:GIY-YIG nuclease family protein [Psychroflexus salis]